MHPFPSSGYKARARILDQGGLLAKLWEFAAATYDRVDSARLWLSCFLAPDQALEDAYQSIYPGDMPKVDDASRVVQFMITDDFNEKFEAWAADMEKTHGGKLKITHEEPIVSQGNTLGFTMWWRVDGGAKQPYVAKRR